MTVHGSSPFDWVQDNPRRILKHRYKSRSNLCIGTVPLALIVMLNEELKREFLRKVLKKKAPARGTPKKIFEPFTNPLPFRITCFPGLRRPIVVLSPLLLRGPPIGKR